MENEKDCVVIDLPELFHVILDNARNIFVVTLCCVLVAAVYVFIQPKAAPSYTSKSLLRIHQMPNIMQTSKRNESLHSTLSEQSGGGVTDGMTNGLTDGQAMPVVDNAAVPYRATSQTTNQDTSENWSTNKSESKSESIDRSISTAGYGTLNLNQRLLTYGEIVKSSALLESVNEAIETTGTVKADPIKDTEMMRISFTANDAEKAKKGNELLIKNFQEYVSRKEHSEMRYIVTDNSDAKKADVNSNVEAVVTERTVIEVIEPPKLPMAAAAANNTKRTLAISALLGILLGSGYAVMHHLLNRKIKTRQDIEDYLGLPVFAVVPEEKSLTEAMARQNDRNVLQKIGGLLWKEQN